MPSFSKKSFRKKHDSLTRSRRLTFFWRKNQEQEDQINLQEKIIDMWNTISCAKTEKKHGTIKTVTQNPYPQYGSEQYDRGIEPYPSEEHNSLREQNKEPA